MKTATALSTRSKPPSLEEPSSCTSVMPSSALTPPMPAMRTSCPVVVSHDPCSRTTGPPDTQHAARGRREGGCERALGDASKPPLSHATCE